MDEMAQRRAVMILGVLSGQVTVTDAIESTGISRGTYYKLEEKALKLGFDTLEPKPLDIIENPFPVQPYIRLMTLPIARPGASVLARPGP